MKTNIKYSAFLFAIVIFTSCQNERARHVASLAGEERNYVIRAYELENKILQLTDLERRTTTAKEQGSQIQLDDPKNKLQKQIQLAQKKLNEVELLRKKAETFNSHEPMATYLNFNNLFFNYYKKISITNKKLYRLQGGDIGRPIHLTLDNAKAYTLEFEQYIQKRSKRKNIEVRRRRNYSTPVPFVKAQFSCEGPFEFETALFFNKKYAADEEVQFDWFLSSDNTQRPKAVITAKSGHCKLRFKDQRVKYGLDILPFSQSLSAVNFNRRRLFEYCQIPSHDKTNKVDQLFLTTDFNSLTCPQKIDSIEMLDDRLDGLNAKVKALLGTPLPEQMVQDQNPYYPLNFQKAPELDAIYISYLVFRRDFYGTVMERLIRYHAARGTLIKIFTSEVISLEKDIKMLNDLENEFPNVMVKLYKFDSFKAEDMMEIFSQLHRTLHVKMFLAYSATNDEDNVAIIGGRNIHDGFVFHKMPNLKAYPELV